MAGMTPRMAREHVLDSQDNLQCCVRNLKRLAKNYPQIEKDVVPLLTQLATTITALKSVRTSLETRGRSS